MTPKRPEIRRKKDGFYVRIDDGERVYDTGPLPRIEDAERRADRELLIEASRGFPWKTYLYGLLFVEVATAIAGSLMGLDIGSLFILAIVVFVLQSVFSILFTFVGK